MTWTFNPAPRGHAVTFDFPVLPRPAGEPLPPALSEPDEDIDCGGASRPAHPSVGSSRPILATANPNKHEPVTAPRVAPGSWHIGERENPAEREDVPRAPDAIVGGGGSDDPPPAMLATPVSPPKRVVACAMSGNLCAVATLEPANQSWRVSRTYSRLFQLVDTSQAGMRGLAGELFQFLAPLQGAVVVSCATKTGSVSGGLEDEARIETLLMMLPKLEVEQVDNDAIANWVLSVNPPEPENMPKGRNTFAQIRAIEAAQYIAGGIT